jgi:Chaperone of endosialidase
VKTTFKTIGLIAAAATLSLPPAFAGSLYVDGDLTVARNAEVGTNLYVDRDMIVMTNAHVVGTTFLGPANAMAGDLLNWHGAGSSLQVGAGGKTTAIYGQLAPDNNNIVKGAAVEGYCSGPDTTGVFGELGFGDAEPFGEFPIRDYYGVYGHANASDFGSYAGYFDGPVHMAGVLSAGANVGIGVSNPGFPLDVDGRIQLRGSGNGTSAGLWLYDADLSGHPERAFVGMDKAGYVGLWGDLGAGWGLIMNVTNGYVGVGATSPGHPLAMAGGAYCTGTQWQNACDRNLKENFQPADPRGILEKVAALPVTTWNYKSEKASVRHLGPTAQDFSAAFHLGDSDKSIGTVDEGGVALAAIQGLNQKLNEKDAEIRDLELRLARLEQLVQTRSAGHE